jgi:aryl-phospho-beta-D-glucosidase BglC (GH1 family)
MWKREIYDGRNCGKSEMAEYEIADWSRSSIQSLDCEVLIEFINEPNGAKDNI